jgi:hypothetical protein
MDPRTSAFKEFCLLHLPGTTITIIIVESPKLVNGTLVSAESFNPGQRDNMPFAQDAALFATLTTRVVARLMTPTTFVLEAQPQ